MTLLQLKNKADPILVDFWQTLTLKEDAFYQKYGRYFQLMVSPETYVVDGADTPFTVRLRDIETNIADATVSYGLIPFQILVNTWKGADDGYQAIVTVKLLDGRIFSRMRDSNQVDSGWFEEKGPVELW